MTRKKKLKFGSDSNLTDEHDEHQMYLTKRALFTDEFRNFLQLPDILAEMKSMKETIITLQKELEDQKKKVEELEKGRKDSTGLDINTEDSAEIKERNRSIVVSNIPECESKFAHERNVEDVAKVNLVFRHLDASALPVSIYRLGRPRSDGKPRLIKVVLPSSANQKEILSKAPRLRSFYTASLPSVFIRKSLSPAELEIRRKELTQRRTENPPLSVNLVNMSPISSAISSSKN
ncbi:unnamed protein product [Caenorhabditis nigoni]